MFLSAKASFLNAPSQSNLHSRSSTRKLNSAERFSIFEDDNSRRTSSSFVEEFFRLASDEKLPLYLRIKPEPGEMDISHIEAFEQENAEVFDIASTMYESVMSSELTGVTADGVSDNHFLSACASVTSAATSDSMWEDLTASVNILDNHMTCDTTAAASSTYNSGSERLNTFTIKAEPTEYEEKPSCQFDMSHSSIAYMNKPSSEDNFLYNIRSSAPIMDNMDIVGSVYNEENASSKTIFGQTFLTNNSNKNHAVLGHSASNSNVTSQASNSRFISPNSQFRHQPSIFISQSTDSHVVPSIFLPPTPPNSQPASPNTEGIRKTPPPPYPSVNSQIPRSILSSVTSSLPLAVAVEASPATSERPRKQPVTHPGCSTIKYNRKNSPELEKRRIHFCSFLGQFFLFISELQYFD